jgi:3-carboxy-cis,cis-muconate cycloisomerase
MSDGLNSFLFSTPGMTRAFSPEAQLRAMMRFEWALTCALEKHGLAAAGSGAVVESMLGFGFVNVETLERDARETGNIAIPFVRQLTAAVKARNEVASRTIHLGATSQDVLDTALVLQMRDALLLLNEAVNRLDAALVIQVREHADTVLSGRTWLQPGPPTTLGLKLAGTLAALRRDRDRIQAASLGALVFQFGGAVGTLASLGAKGRAVSNELAQILELPEPEMPWHAQRDRLVEIVQVLAVLTGTLAKFARDIALLMQVEVDEVTEGDNDARGGSSTMPHKRNPVGCAAVLAAHARMPGLVVTMLQAMPQEHERGLGFWQAEWETLPEAFRLAAAALEYSIEIAEGLQVNPARMQANFDKLLGTTMSEAVSAALAASIGRSEANSLLRDAAGRALREQRHLRDVLLESSEILPHLDRDAIEHLMNPRAYLGSARRFIAKVLREPNANS